MAMKRRPALSELTLREKIGQTCQVQLGYLMGIENLEEWLAENPIGNIWHTCNEMMTTVNLSSTLIDEPQDSTFYRKWTQRVSNALRIPPLFTQDEPGSTHGTDLLSLCSVPALGANNSEEAMEEYAKLLALNGKSLGCNSTWAPNVDLPPRFAGVNIMRTTSNDPDTLIKLSLAFIRSAQANGFGVCAKHFPGRDKREYRDGHFTNTYTGSTMEEWWAAQGRVFQAMIDGGVLSIMPSHEGFPAVDNSRIYNYFTPTTLSKKVITGLLKEQMGFKGCVVTDGINMGALKTAYPDPEDLFVALLNAGNDVLLSVRRMDYIDIIERAVKDGRVAESRIDDACERVLYMKEKLGFFEPQEEVVMTEEIRQQIRDFNTKVAENSLVLQCDNKNLLPLDPTKIKSVAIICSSHVDTFHVEMQAMAQEFERRGIRAHVQRCLKSYEEMEKIAAEYDLILYPSFVMPHMPMGGSGLFCEECAHFFFALTAGKEKSIGISMGSPYIYYDYCMNMDTYIHAFSKTPESQKAIVRALFGEIGFTGTYQYEEPWKDELKWLEQ